ncbi:phage protein [Burkholderia cepacia]|uniref:phage protein n=1 Tax=Burkholderia cepacia TaxID=292 RepID=UPI000F5E9477|nr:hypothetical protein [Burkholderia cepacia]RRA01117.1 hypothetical protein DF055_21830 [Burkholderia cepacia]RRA04450.1 hypothetical protein DF054_23745 [Burkholderia cepacia]
MTAQFDRKATLLAGGADDNGIDLSELRFTFEVRRGDTQTPNWARIKIFNPNPSDVNRIRDEFSRVVLSAGYAGNIGIIFDGQLVQPRQGRENATDTYLDLTCADGDRAYNFAVVSTTLAAGATHADVVNAVAQAMAKKGVTLGYIPDLTGNAYPRGCVLFGMARDIMETVAVDLDMDWSIQNGQLTMIPRTSFIPGEAVVVAPDTGMVGLPVQMRNYIMVRILLNPNVKIGTIIRLENSLIQQYEFSLNVNQQGQNGFDALQNRLNNASGQFGFYRVMIAEHIGDTRGNDWYTDVTCIAVDTTATIELANKATQGAVAPAPPKIDPSNPFGSTGPVNPYG